MYRRKKSTATSSDKRRGPTYIWATSKQEYIVPLDKRYILTRHFNSMVDFAFNKFEKIQEQCKRLVVPRKVSSELTYYIMRAKPEYILLFNYLLLIKILHH